MEPESSSTSAHQSNHPGFRFALPMLAPAVIVALAAVPSQTPLGQAAPDLRDGAGIQASCPDLDLDGFAVCAGGCQPGPLACGDCDDDDPLMHPGAVETCNHHDEDCDGVPDEGFPTVVASRLTRELPAQDYDGFGSVLVSMGDISGDGRADLAIGAHFWDNAAGVQVGSILVVSGADDSPLCRMVDPLGQSSDNVGETGAVVGDLNGDAVPDLAAGAGSKVVIFSGADCSLIRRCSSPDFNRAPVAGAGDLNLDGVPDIFVGAPYVTGAAPYAGKVVALSGSDCSTIFSYVDPQGQYLDSLGRAVAGIGDVTGDGRPDVAALSSRFVHVLSGAGGGLVRKVSDPATVGIAGFTYGLQGMPDISGDGVPDIAAGTLGNETSMSSPGGVLLVSGGNGAILRRCVDPNASPGDSLGSSLAVVPDQTGDGLPDILAGAPFDSTSLGTAAGSAILFSSADCGVLRRFEDPRGAANRQFGMAVAAVGDLSGDGLSEFAAAPAADPDLPNTTAVLLLAIESVCDGDGLSPFEGDCDDTDAGVYPQAAEICDGRDNNCDAAVDEDADGDGYGACADCDPVNPGIHPEAPEICNGRDDDCDGAVDEGSDIDGDGATTPCDCNDSSPGIHPGASEVCDHVDQNCDGRRDETSPAATTLLPGPDPSGGQGNYSLPLATPGDVTGDGVPDMAVGYATATTIAGASAGTVIVYSGRDRSEFCRAIDPEGVANDQLGFSLAALGDVTGDGVGDLAAAARYDNVGGVAYDGSVLIVSGADCQVVRKCTDPPGGYDRALGTALAAIGDVTGDGRSEIAASAPGAAPAGVAAAGEVTLFDPTTCAIVHRFADPTGTARVGMGRSLAATGDVSGDGVPDIAVGSHRDRRLGTDPGSVLIFSGADGTLIRRLLHPSPSSGDYFGWAVTAVGDMTGDGVDDLAVSAMLDGIGGMNQGGSVLFYSGRDGAFLRLCSDADTNRLGSAVAPAGDVTGDGIPDLVAGAGEDAFLDFPISQWARGAVLVFSGSDCAVARRIVDPSGRNNHGFGGSVMVAGDFGGDGAAEIVTVSRPRLWIIGSEADCDGDGVAPLGGDCDETDPARAAGRLETCDARDNDCDGMVDEDDDADGFAVCADCDDLRFDAHPGATEVCNGQDDDCDSAADEGFDVDGDGTADCFDNCPSIQNAAQSDADGDGTGDACDVETCDGFDNDGDGSVDEGFGDIPETCNHLDDNCDGEVDPGALRAWGARGTGHPQGAPGDRFGQSIAGIGDVTLDHVPDLVVGATGDATPNGYLAGSGAILSGTDQSVVCDLVDPTGESSDRLGTAAVGLGDMDGDGIPDVALGAPEDFNGAGYRGSVSIFSGADCSFLRKCADPIGPPGTFSDHLGQSLAPLGDVTGDGVPDLAAGAPSIVTGSTVAGAVVIFSGADCSVARRLTDPLGVVGANLGAALASPGDLSGDGVADLLAGAPGGAGGAVVFSLQDGSVLRRLADPGTASGSRIGSAVAAMPDLSADGIPDLAVGAMGDDAVLKDAGSVLLFSGADGALLRKCVDPTGSPLAALGSGLAAYPDLDGDGTADVVALAPFQHTPLGPRHGRALIFSGRTCDVLARIDLNAGQWLLGTFFPGTNLAVAVPGDLDGDHASEIAVGAPAANGGLSGTGLALILGRTSDCDADGATPFGGDCDDDSAARTPGRVEVCDGADNDCDALVDEDSDVDGYAACADCDNGRAATHPGASETCNGTDDDCDLLVDDGPDSDGDGITAACDCADTSPAIRPGAAEVCNHVDDDCDSVIDENQPQVRTAALITDPEGASNGRFGKGVAGLGDVDGDAVPDLAIANDVNGVLVISGRSGAIRCRGTGRPNLVGIQDVSGDGVPDILSGGNGSVFILSGASCALVRTCSVPDLLNKELGISIAVLGDVNGDGVPDLAAGAPGPGTTGSGGEVAVFSAADCSLLYRASDPGLAPAPGYSVRFGSSVAGPGDLTGDGWPDLVVGAPDDSSLGIPSAGRLVVVSGPDGTVVRRLHDPAAAYTDRLGTRIESTGDLDDDGVSDLLAFVDADYPSRIDAGAVLLFSGADGSVLRRCSDPTAPSYEHFGRFFVPTRDATGDGLADFAATEVGTAAPGAPYSGQVLLVSSADCAIVARLKDPATTTSGYLGEGSLAAPGDLTGDGKDDLVAGADATTAPFPFPRGHVVIFGESSSCDPPGDNCAAVTNPLQLDSDQDGIGNLCDACPGTSDPAQGDADADGAGDACDCLPVNPAARPPAEVVRLDVTPQGRIIWTATATAESYAIRRGDLAQLSIGNYGACWQRVTGLRAGDAGVLDTAVPAAGTGVFYLVNGEDATCGRGLLGFDSAERARVVTGPDPCP